MISKQPDTSAYKITYKCKGLIKTLEMDPTFNVPLNQRLNDENHIP